ncbi:MAG: carboxypeptidase regulatory-like domain-containing protein [Deltaproteobacteria bacterium]|nr:carboxypeptidase regulatory-like domain-containing protein [Deltaproteobacteria bacterium]
MKSWKRGLLLGLLVAGLAGCPEEPADPGTPLAAEGGAATAPAPPPLEGKLLLKGTVHFEGEAPARVKLDRRSDPVCAKTDAYAEEVLVADGKLANVVVTISDPRLPKKTASEELTIGQAACLYRPRVQCGLDGQVVRITNSDPTLHNVHGFREGGARSWFNQAQLQGAPAIRKKLKGPEVAVFKCDIHTWMAAYVRVTESGHCAVTTPDGRYALPGLPPGTWMVTAWHEVYGEQQAEITLVEGEEAHLDFKFGPADGP